VTVYQPPFGPGLLVFGDRKVGDGSHRLILRADKGVSDVAKIGEIARVRFKR
jgi:hypothetical protein